MRGVPRPDRWELDEAVGPWAGLQDLANLPSAFPTADCLARSSSRPQALPRVDVDLTDRPA